MQDTKDQLIITIVAVVLVLLFLGILFLIMLFYYNNKKMQMAREKQQMKDLFEKQLLQSRLEMQEQTFNSISQEIHDNVGQTLSLAKVQVGIIDEKAVLDTAMLAEVKDNISRAMTELRDIARSLNNQRLQTSSLSECVTQELARIKKTGFIDTRLTTVGEEQKLEYQQKLLLFRIVQEALQNILKHARATEVTVQIDHGNPLSIIIQDNGTGFNVQQKMQGNGLGLQNIVNRASLIGGTVNIDSAVNKGTTVAIIIPYE